MTEVRLLRAIEAQNATDVFGDVGHQQLLPRVGGGLIATREVLVNTPACANLIRENKVEQIKNVIQTGAALGMVSYTQDIKRLVKEGLITAETAENYLIASNENTK